MHHFLAKGDAPVRDLEHKEDRKDLTSNRRPRRRPILERERERETARRQEEVDPRREETSRRWDTMAKKKFAGEMVQTWG